MEVLVNNCQPKTVKQKDLTRLQRLAKYVLKKEGVSTRAELSIALVGEKEIHELNSKYRKIDAPTDVLSFAMVDQLESIKGENEQKEDKKTGKEPLMIGEVVISPEFAEKQSRQRKRSFENELDLLLVHGILHILGYVHDNETSTETMQNRENFILDEFEKNK